MWLARQGLPIGAASDKMECACPVLRKLVIRRNDWTPIVALQEWAPLIAPRLIDSRRDLPGTKCRADAVARYAMTVIVPSALRTDGRYVFAAEIESMQKDPLEYIGARVAEIYCKIAALPVSVRPTFSAVESAARYARNECFAETADAAVEAADLCSIFRDHGSTAGARESERLAHVDAMIALVEGIQ